MNNTFIKRALALLLVIVLCIGLLPANALADEIEAAMESAESAPAATQVVAEAETTPEPAPAPEPTPAPVVATTEPVENTAAETPVVENTPADTEQASTPDDVSGEDASNEGTQEDAQADEGQTDGDAAQSDTQEAGESDSAAQDNASQDESSQEPETKDEAQSDKSDESSDTSSDAEETEEAAEAEEEEDAIEYPAQSFVRSAGGVGVIVHAPEGAFPKGTEMVLSAVSDAVAQQAAEAAMGSNAQAVAAVDISFVYEGGEIEPLLPITVTMASKEIAKADNATLVHRADSGAVETMGASTSGSIMQFASDAFSIYVIATEETVKARVTYQFQNADGTAFTFQNTAGQSVSTQIIKDGDALQNVGLPAIEEGQKFQGWYVCEGENYTQEVSFGTPITVNDTDDGKVITVRPYFGDVGYLVFYEDAAGTNVLTKKQVPLNTENNISGEKATAPNAELSFSGWSKTAGANNDGRTPLSGDGLKVTLTTVNEEMAFYPIFASGHWISFHAGATGSGATYSAPVFVPADGTLDSLPSPTWKGYQFRYWTTENLFTGENGAYVLPASAPSRVNTPASFTEATTLYAYWTPADTTYTVVFWLQSLDDAWNAAEKTYSYGTQSTENGTTGQTVYAGNYSNRYPGFTLNTTKSDTSMEITSDGKAVINIYFDRNVVTINFNSGNSHISYKGLYGQPLEFYDYEWPEGLWSYKVGSGWGATTYTISYLSDFAVPGDENATELTLTKNNNRSVDLVIYFQGVEDSQGKYDHATVVNTAVTTGGTWYFDEIYTGYTVDQYRITTSGWGGGEGSWTTTSNTGSIRLPNSLAKFEIRYKRNIHKVQYLDSVDNTALKGISAASVAYGASVSGAQPSASFVPQSQYAGKVFEGWYKDPTCKEAFDWSITMPDADVPVYAGWTDNKYRVQIDPNGGALSGTESTYFNNTYGQTVDRYDDVVRDYVEIPAGSIVDAATQVFYYHYDAFVEELNGSQTGERKAYYTTDASKSTDGKMYTYEKGAYALIGWYKVVDGIVTDIYNFGEAVTEPVYIQAQWRKVGEYRPYYNTTSYVMDESGNLAKSESVQATSVKQDSYSYADLSQSAMLPAAGAPDNYVFKGWYYDGTVYTPGDVYTIKASLARNVVQGQDGEGNDIVIKRIDIFPVFQETKQLPVEVTKIVFNGNGGTANGEATVTIEPQQINAGHKLSNEGFTYPGHKLVGWSLDANAQPGDRSVWALGTEIGADNLDDTSNTLYAVYETETYTVTVQKVVVDGVEADKSFGFTSSLSHENFSLKNGESKVFTGVAYNTSVTVTEGVEGYDTTVKVIDADGKVTETAASTVTCSVDSNITIVFTNTPKTYTVTWKNWDGSVLEKDERVPYGATPSYDGANPTKAADAQYTYTFAGWTPEIVAVTGDATYTATYDKTTNKYTVTFVDEDGETVLKEATEYDYGTKADDIAKPVDPTKPETPEYTYTFAGWTPTIADVTEDATYKATYAKTANKYNVTYKNGDTVVSGPTAVAFGTNVTVGDGVAAPSKEGHSFTGWTTTDATVTDGSFTMPAKDVVLYANFTANIHRVTYQVTAPDGVEVTNVPEVAEHAFDATVPVAGAPTVPVGYTFTGWSKDSSPIESGATFQMPDADVIITGTVTANTDTGYKVEYYFQNVEGNAYELDNDKTERKTGTTGETATADTTKTFTGFTFDQKNSANVLSAPINGDGTTTLKLYYNRETYTLTYRYDGVVPAGAIPETAPAGGSYKFKETVNVAQVTAPEGYTFSGWTIQDDPMGGTIQTTTMPMPNKNITLVGSFEGKPAALTYDANGGTGGTDGKIIDNGDGTYKVGAPAVVKEGTIFTAPAGYHFEKWNTQANGEGDSYSASAQYTLLTENSDVLYAQWMANDNTEYKVEYYFQNVDNDNYTLDKSKTDKLTGTTGAEVNADTSKSFTGFTFDENNGNNVLSATINGDGSTTLKLYYNRNTYTVSYEYNAVEGASKLPDDATYRFGATVTVAPAATAAGYSFDGWNSQKVDATNGQSFEMPADNVKFTGTFNAQPGIGYKVYHYQQNVDLNGYTLKDTDTLTGTTGTTVEAVAKDYSGFTVNYDAQGTVRLATLKGDGTTELYLYYDRNTNLGYTVKYAEKDSNPVNYIALDKVETGKTFGAAYDEAAIDIPGYNKVEPTTAKITIGTGDNVYTFFYTKKTDLTYTVNYLEKNGEEVTSIAGQNPKIVTGKTLGDVVNAADEVISIDGYNYVNADKAQLTIGANAQDNVINLYYEKRTDLSYTVNYLEKLEDGTEQSIHAAKTSDANMTFGAVVNAEDEVIDIDGFSYASASPESITISTTAANNVINLYYTRNEYRYTVNHYTVEVGAEPVLHHSDASETAAYQSVINAADKVADISGYKFDSERSDSSITIGTENNVLNLYYDADKIGGGTPENPTGDGTPDKYQVTVNYRAVNGTVAPVQQVITLGTSAAPATSGTITTGATATPAAGYALDYWTNDKDNAQNQTGKFTLNVTGGDVITVTANFATDVIGGKDPENPGDEIPDKYQVQVVYTAEGHGKLAEDQTTTEVYTADKNADGSYQNTVSFSSTEKTAVADRGYKLNNWTENRGNTSNSDTSVFSFTNVPGGMTVTITASFVADESVTEPITYTVQHVVDGQVQDTQDYSQNVWVNATDKTISVTADSIAWNNYEGYDHGTIEADGYDTIAAGTKVADGTIITLNYVAQNYGLTFSAVLRSTDAEGNEVRTPINDYTVTVNDNAPASQYAFGTDMRVVITVNNDGPHTYRFDSWESNPESLPTEKVIRLLAQAIATDPAKTFVMPASDVALTAVFEEVSADYTVEYLNSADESTLKEARTGNGLIGDTVSVTDADKATITVDGVKYVFDAGMENVESATLAADNNVLKLYFAEDKIGGGDPDPTDPDNPNRPDGIPDKYQVTVNYVAGDGGTVTGKTSEVLTIPNNATSGTVTTSGSTATGNSSRYTFVNWTTGDNAASADGVYTLDVNGGDVINITANFNYSGGGGNRPRPDPNPDPTPTPDPDPDPIDIPDPDVPMSDLPDIDIPDEDVPMADLPDVDIVDEDVPMADLPDIDIVDEDVPLAPAPAAPATVSISDEAVPLADTPKTDDSRHTGLWAGMAMTALAGLAVLFFDQKRRAEQ